MWGKKKKKAEKKEEERSSISAIITRETIGLTLIVFSVLALIILWTGSLLFGSVGIAVRSFLYGMFGFMAYYVLVSLLYCGLTMVIGRNFIPNRSMTVFLFTSLALIGLIVHVALTGGQTAGVSYPDYLVQCFTSSQEGALGTPFGLFGGLFAYPFLFLMTASGTYIILGLAVGLCGFLFVRGALLFHKGKTPEEEKTEAQAPQEAAPVHFENIDNTRYDNGSYPAYGTGYTPAGAGYTPAGTGYAPAGAGYTPAGTYGRPEAPAYTPASAPAPQPAPSPVSPVSAEQSYMESVRNGMPSYQESKEILYGNTDPMSYKQRNLIFDNDSQYNRHIQGQNATEKPSYENMYSGGIDRSTEPTPVPKEVISETPSYSTYRQDVYNVYSVPKDDAPVCEEPVVRPSYRAPEAPKPEAPEMPEMPAYESPFRPERTYPTREEAPIPPFEEERSSGREVVQKSLRERFREEEIPQEEDRTSRASIFDDVPSVPEPEDPDIRGFGRSAEMYIPERDFTPRETYRERMTRQDPVPPAEIPQEEEPVRPIREYVRPSIDLLDVYDETPLVSEEEKTSNMNGIIEALALFRINAESAGVTVGPTFTRYELSVPLTVNARDIACRSESIARNIHVSSVNISTNFETNTISVEVPNRKRATVGLRSMLTSPAYVNAKAGSLAFCVGKNIEGDTMVDDVCKMPHMLVAGTTGSGKSVFMNSIILSLIMKYSPEECRLLLVDPKHNEFAFYAGIPHLLIDEIFYSVDKVIVMLNWLINEMENRYVLFSQLSEKNHIPIRTIDEYNGCVEKREDRLPKIVVLADELADLMVQKKKDVESRISRLAAKARACGIHLILATQYPTNEVVTGVIKANMTARFAFSVATPINSNVILTETGAENLLGKGDLLYKTGHEYGGPLRVQSAWVSNKEIQRVCDFIRENNEAYFDKNASKFIANDGREDEPVEQGEISDGKVEKVFIDALRYIIKSGSASISMIQRKCNVGYNKAGKIVEWMEINNYISQYEGAKARTVLITEEQFEELYGDL